VCEMELRKRTGDLIRVGRGWGRGGWLIKGARATGAGASGSQQDSVPAFVRRARDVAASPGTLGPRPSEEQGRRTTALLPFGGQPRTPPGRMIQPFSHPPMTDPPIERVKKVAGAHAGARTPAASGPGRPRKVTAAARTSAPTSPALASRAFWIGASSAHSRQGTPVEQKQKIKTVRRHGESAPCMGTISTRCSLARRTESITYCPFFTTAGAVEEDHQQAFYHRIVIVIPALLGMSAPFETSSFFNLCEKNYCFSPCSCWS
jgi:hypothetical protein